MRRRPSSRLLILDQQNRILLLHFVYQHGALAGKEYWATPGGGLEGEETFPEAARRELFEETGIVVDAIGQPIEHQEYVLQMPNGEYVIADEYFFLARVANPTLISDRRTTLETQIITEHRWWTLDELMATNAVVFPKNLPTILMKILH